jgi:hydroxymethylpyrimidine pyrophosphatase-like HAD family hydrolase
VILVSFDIDGTLEVGDPPGPVTLSAVRRARELGYVIGSASDRTRREQSELWSTAGIDVAFVGGKHHLHEVRARFDCARYVHIGDTIIDEMYALRAGFEFQLVDTLPADGAAGWLW